MKTPHKMAIAIVAALAGSTAWAGTEGHGGGGFICQDPSQSELLDLFEARIPGIIADGGLNITRSSAPVEEQIQAAFNRLMPDMSVGHSHLINRDKVNFVYRAVLDVYGRVRSAKIHPMDPGYIAWPTDAVSEVTKPGCTPTGLVLFNDESNSMLLDSQSVAALPNTDQAALWVHETIYKFLRETLDTRFSADEGKTFWDREARYIFSSVFNWPALIEKYYTSFTPDLLSYTSNPTPADSSAIARKIVAYLFSDASSEVIDGDFSGWSNGATYQPPLGPIRCPTGTRAFGFHTEGKQAAEFDPKTGDLVWGDVDFVVDGRIFDARRKAPPIAELGIDTSHVTQVCLASGKYRFSYKITSPRITTPQTVALAHLTIQDGVFSISESPGGSGHDITSYSRDWDSFPACNDWCLDVHDDAESFDFEIPNSS